MYKTNRLAVKLRPIAEKSVKQGHPWVFSESIVKIKKGGKAGDLAVLFDQFTDKVYGLGLYDPDSPIRIKIIHVGNPVQVDEDFFQKKVVEASKKRQPLLKTDTNAYRLIFGENDGFPGLIFDVYNNVGVLKLYSAIWFPYLDFVIPHLVKEAKIEGLILRLSRNVQKLELNHKEGDVLYGKIEKNVVEFREYGVKFQTDILLGHKTGFFLDHRENRYKIRQLARDKTVLDVFSYAGGFSVHALAGGAKEVTSLDFSEQALELAQKNRSLNSHTGKHVTIAGDAFELLNKMIKEGKTYDVVVIDPPSFAKSKSERNVAKKKYSELAELGVYLTKKEGLLLLASCSSRIDEKEFLELHKEVFRRLGVNYSLEEVTAHAIDHPIGFEEGAYLKSAYYRFFLTKKNERKSTVLKKTTKQ